MRKKMTLICGFLMLIFCLQAHSQRLEYNIIWLGKIGKLHINKTNKDAYSSIETKSEVKIPFYKLNWITTTTEYNGLLQSSNYAQLLNDKKKEYTEIEHTNDSIWQVTFDNGNEDFISIKHKLKVSDLYFEEPVNEQHIFSERFGKPLELVNKGEGHYRLLLPEKNYCDFFYTEGICKIVKAKNGNRTIKFVLADKS